MIVRLRWWIFHRLSELGMWVCPKREKPRSEDVMPVWKDYPE